MMLTVLVTNRKPLPYGCTSVLLTAAGSTGVAGVAVATHFDPARNCHAPGTLI